MKKTLSDVVFRFAVWVFGTALIACAAPTVAAVQVVLNEVMFDPVGSEFTDEYIELYNAGETEADLSGWRIGDDDELDALMPIANGMVLAPGAYALVLDADYFSGRQPYDLPKGVLMLTVDGATLGDGGLSNTRSERVLLVSMAGDTVGAMAYEPGNLPGISEEKIDPLRGDLAGNWVDARWPTPGRVNSVSVKVFDVALRTVTDSPLLLPWGQSGAFEFDVVNLGRASTEVFDVAVQGVDGALQLVRVGPIASGDSVRTSALFDAPAGDQEQVWATVRWLADQDSTNDGVEFQVIGGVPSGGVVISEVMAAPHLGMGEWIELTNLLDQPIDLRGWTLADAASVGRVTEDGRIAAKGYAILVEKEAGGQTPFGDISTFTLSRWPRLNDGGDVLVLRDATGTTVDSVAYPEGDRTVSLERIDVSAPGFLLENWLASTHTDGATPGGHNSVAVTGAENVALLADPNPFVSQTIVTYELPAQRAFVNLWVFDRLGRRVCTLLDAAEGGSRREVTWNGTTDRGRSLKPGIYVLVLEAHTDEGILIRKKAPVVLSRGL